MAPILNWRPVHTSMEPAHPIRAVKTSTLQGWQVSLSEDLVRLRSA